jgi:hypothetical protein
MKKLTPVSYVFALVSLAIALYQFSQGTILYGSLSVVYALVFAWVGFYNRKRTQR